MFSCLILHYVSVLLFLLHLIPCSYLFHISKWGIWLLLQLTMPLHHTKTGRDHSSFWIMRDSSRYFANYSFSYCILISIDTLFRLKLLVFPISFVMALSNWLVLLWIIGWCFWPASITIPWAFGQGQKACQNKRCRYCFSVCMCWFNFTKWCWPLYRNYSWSYILGMYLPVYCYSSFVHLFGYYFVPLKWITFVLQYLDIGYTFKFACSSINWLNSQPFWS